MKMLANRGFLGLLLAAVAITPGWAQQTASERSAFHRYRQYAEAPVDHVRFYQIQGFQYLAPDTVAIRFGVNQMYLVTVATPCINLAYTNAIGLTSQAHTFYSKLDFITFRGPGGLGQRCRILGIVPVNELKMKRDAAKADSQTPKSARSGLW